jgi:hypothetical protein
VDAKLHGRVLASHRFYPLGTKRVVGQYPVSYRGFEQTASLPYILPQGRDELLIRPTFCPGKPQKTVYSTIIAGIDKKRKVGLEWCIGADWDEVFGKNHWFSDR